MDKTGAVFMTAPVFSFEARKEAHLSADTIVWIPLADLKSSPFSPFAVRDDEAMRILAESVRTCGVLTPAIVRPLENGYEIVSGHRRTHACELAGFDEMPCIVRDLDDDEAVIQMVDANAQREEVLPSERAKAYQLRLEAIKRQGQRTDLTSTNDSAKFRSDDLIGAECGVSGDTVRNTIKLNNLIPPLLRMVDEKKISLTPAYQIADLTEHDQELLVETIDSEQATPSVSQAQRMKKLSRDGELNEDTMLEILSAPKKPESMNVVLSGKRLEAYFPRSWTPAKIEATIYRLLDVWQRNRQKKSG